MTRMSFLLLVLALTTRLRAQDRPAGDPGPLGCKVEGSTVTLSWNIQFLVPIHGWLITRDGQNVASLDSNAQEFIDKEVPAGAHLYSLFAVAMDGTVGEMGSCQVTVGDSGMTCKVEGRSVHLEWGPIFIAVVIEKFVIYRNGDIIATLPPDQLSYTDLVPGPGAYDYKVAAVTGPDSQFTVGACSVEVECFNLSFQVEGLQVHLEWANAAGDPVNLPALFYQVVRDGEVVARTGETKYLDTVPGPGRYGYEIWLSCLICLIPDRLIAACGVEVPGDGLPPPQDLVCRVVPSPGPVPLDPNDPVVGPDGAILPISDVILSWRNPTRYDEVLVFRNGMLIATLPGSETEFRDHTVRGGTFVYGVVGVALNRRSPAAECRVEVPPIRVPPPQDFTCTLDDLILDPADPDLAANGLPAPPPGEVAPFTAVVLRWSNPIRYRGLVVIRDGLGLAKLPGDAMAYRDIAPPPGEHVYGIFGIALDGRESPTVECKITVGKPVPPVEELACSVLATGTAAGTVGLRWRNPVAYDAIFISRNGQRLARLPGDAAAYTDAGLAPGVYLYEVTAALGNLLSPPAVCQVVVEGPPTRNLLYFSSGFNAREVDPTNGVPIPVPAPGHRITCLATNSEAVQGWSFGVQSDPKFVVPVKHDLEGTATAALNGGKGPAFLAVKLFPEGVTMAVVISNEAPFDTLPPDAGHRLLNIEYGAGPSGAHGEVYRVRYSDALGDPPVQVLLVVKGFEVRPSTLPGLVSIPGFEYLRSDVNADGEVDISDPMTILNWLFLGARPPHCLEACDVNGSQNVNLADPIFLFSFLFMGGDPPPFPFPDCAPAPIPLGCEESNCP